MPDVETSENTSGGSTEITPIDGMPSETTGEPDIEEDAPYLDVVEQEPMVIQDDESSPTPSVPEGSTES